MAEESPNHGQMTIIELQAIDPSPFQRRQHFEEDKLKGLAASVQRDGLIEPIVVRPNGERYQLIAGERRWHMPMEWSTATRLESRGLPFSERVRYRFYSDRRVSFANRFMPPIASAILRRATGEHARRHLPWQR